jgi:hypothetical protein
MGDEVMAQALAAVGPVMQAVGTVGSTASNVIAQDVQSKALDAEGRSIAEQAAFDERQQRRANRLMLGEGVARGAASGVAITSGSPLLHELDRVRQSEIEALSIRRQGEIGQSVKRFESRMTRKQIPFTILAGATSLASQGAGAMGKK